MNIKKVGKYYKATLYLFLLALIIINIFLFVDSTYKNSISNLEELTSYDCIYSTNDVSNYFKEQGRTTQISVGYKEISIYPDISNLSCIGKLYSIPNLENFSEGNLYIQIYTSTNLINLLNSAFIVLSILVLVIWRKFYQKYIAILMLLCLFEILNSNYFFTGLHAYNYQYFISSIILFSILFGNYDFLNKKNTLVIENIKKINFNNDLNNLRALAVIAVVLYHFEIYNFTGGWLGVDIFFHISGFLISNRILNDIKHGSFTFKTFYLKRVKRILPALYSTLIFASVVSYFIFSPKALISYFESVISSIFIFSNYYFLNFDFYTAYSTKFLPLLHTWSLSIEEQFYLIFPLFIYIVFKIKKKYLLQVSLGLLFFSIYINLEMFSNGQKFYLLQFRIWQFIFGMFVMFFYLADYRFNKVFYKYLGYFLLMFSVVYFDNSQLSTFLPKLMISLSFLLIVLTKKDIGLLANKYIKYIGLSSYSIYLLHQPILAFYKYLNRQGLGEQTSYLSLILIFITIILGLINWYFVETSFIKSKSTYKSIFLAFLGLTLFSASGIYTKGFSERQELEGIPNEVIYYSINVNQYPLAKMKQDNMDYVCGLIKIPYFELNKNIVRYNCDSGPFTYVTPGVEKNLFVIGDSHANMVSVSMIENLNNTYNLTPLNGTLGRCIISGQADSEEMLYACSEQFFNSFINNLDNTKDVVVIVGRFDNWISEIGKSEYQSSKDSYLLNLENRVQRIIENSSSVVIIYPVPTYPYDVAEQYVSGNIKWPEIVSLDLDSFDKQYQDSYAFLDNFESNKIIRIYPEEIFCDSFLNSKCVASFDGILYYSDSNHLTLNGSDLLAENISGLLINK